MPTSTQTTADPTPNTQGQVITIKIMDGGSPAFDTLISGFYVKYPNYRIEKVNFQPPPGSEFTQYIKDQLNQGAADVVSIFDQESMTKENLLLPLEPFIQKSKFDVKPYGPALDQLKYEGKLYGLPFGIYPQVIAYNQDLFQAAGVAAPKAGWTWEDFRTAAAKVTKGEGDAKVWGFYSGFPDGLPRTYVQSKTGYAGPFPPTDDLKEALQFYRTMIFTDKSMPPSEKRDYTNRNGGGFSRGPNQAGFDEGKAGMALEFLPNLTRFQHQQINFKWDVAPMPTVPGGKNQVYVSPQTMGIAANSKQSQVAWEFLMYAAGPEGAQIMAKHGELPMYQSADVKKAWFEQQPAPPAGSEFLFSTTYALLTPDKSFTGRQFTDDEQKQLQQVFGGMQNAMNGVLSGDKAVEDALREYSQAVEQGRKLVQ